MQDFHSLDVWQRAHRLALDIRHATHRFPRRGYASMKAQLLDAAESIPRNIVEGCGAATHPEFARFLDIAIKSSSEVEYSLLLAADAGAMAVGVWRVLSPETVAVRKMLFALRKSVLRGDPSNDRSPTTRRLTTED
jgi:four helix bundle protein